ncbi:MAG TPA: hypothetical protein VHP83_21790 [Aggregatilineaceae bacterium]|nr:hypothetical protein [Aggregatilineaceae bacterium]
MKNSLLIALIFVLAACGGGDSEEAPELVAPVTHRTAIPTIQPSVTPQPATVDAATATEEVVETATEPAIEAATELAVEAATNFEVVSLKNEINNFLTESDDAQLMDRIDIFYRTVSGPASSCFESSLWGETDPLELLGFNPMTVDLEAWHASADAFPEAELMQHVNDTLAAAYAVVPSAEPLRFCLLPIAPYAAPEEVANGGVNSFVLGDVVLITCMAGDYCLDEVDREAVISYGYALQTVDAGLGGAETPLLNFAVYWARAGLLAEDVLPDVSLPWNKALTAEQETELWTRMQENLYAIYDQYPAGRRIDSFLYGDTNRTLYPTWGGVYIGARIVEAYQDEHRTTKLPALFALMPRDLFNESGYAPGGEEDSNGSLSGVGF